MIIAIKEKDKVVIGYSNLDTLCSLSNKDYVDEENLAIKFSNTDKTFVCSDMNRRSDVLLYDEDADLAALAHAVQSINLAHGNAVAGDSVLALRALPEGLRYKKLLRFTAKGLEAEK